jgi:hypothetical protein
MRLDHLPTNIEQNVQRIADELHIPRDEALLKVIETGLTFIKPAPTPTPEDEEMRIQKLLGEPLDDEEAALIDEVVTEAMEARKQRWEHWLSA